MRALYLPELEDRESYQLTGEPLHHLVNVVRVEKGEDLLLLDGKGTAIKTTVEDVSKKNLLLRKLEAVSAKRPYLYDLAVGVPKKDALELTLKQAVELGFRKIFLIRSAFSQMRLPEPERFRSLLISALEQSNAPFLPEVVEASWQQMSWNDYGTVLVLDSQRGAETSERLSKSPGLLVVGPEGGFSPEESAYFQSQSGVESLLLPTPILRTPTAVAAGTGVLLQRLMS